jgi:LacI family transcriptional regulator
MKAKRTSLADIAESLNISKSTVSFVLNGKGDQFNISQATQKLIQEKARELNYVPNFFAKGLREGKTQTIGLVLADISNPFYSGLSKTIQQSLYANRYSLFIVSTNDDPEAELQLLKDLILRSVDALIIATCNPVPDLQPILDETPIPVIFMDRIADDKGDFVGIDNALEAGKLLDCFETRPKKVGIIHPDSTHVMTTRLRMEGASRACENRDIPYEMIQLSGSEREAGKQIEKMLKAGVDAVIPLDSKTALTTLAALKKLNADIPKDVRFISFEDTEAFSYFTPPITALRQPTQRIGEETVKRVLERLKANTVDRRHHFEECELITRGSH